MPDWNPAEIIGSSPHLLAASLYDEIITGKVWHQARASQGYTDVDPARLVVLFGNKPYVDVRNSFNAMIPAELSPNLREKLIAFYLDKLSRNPHFQDKVEFEILFTCYDLSFGQRSRELLETGFYPEEISELRIALLRQTNNLLDVTSIRSDIQDNEQLEEARKLMPFLTENDSPQDRIDRALRLIDMCKEQGTFQFSRLARLGFIGKIILKSLVEQQVIAPDVYTTFLESINTVASNFTRDIDRLSHGELSKEDFLQTYGHLRPGTYDIRVPRYDMSDNYFSSSDLPPKTVTLKSGKFELSTEAHEHISEILAEHGVSITSQELFEFIRLALEAREYSKFLFTKCLSDAIELIALAGESLGFSREDLSHLDVESIRGVQGKQNDFIVSYWYDIIGRNKLAYALNSYLVLPPVIFSEADFEIISSYNSEPNFITTKKVKGEVLVLVGENQSARVTGKIVVLEAADPGFDWIFAKQPAALITKYGGPASHMAVRCAELGLPAVIGCGDEMYNFLLQNQFIAIDCENEKIESSKGIN